MIAEYRVARIPKAWRTEYWTKPTRAPPPHDDWHDIHYSLQPADRMAEAGRAEIERQWLVLTRDIAADVGDCLAPLAPEDAARSRSGLPSAGCGPISLPATRDTLFEHSKPRAGVEPAAAVGVPLR